MNEEWRAVEGFDDRYAVSNLGRVKITRHLKHSICPPGTILNPTPHYKNKYLSISLSTYGKKPKRVNIQRLVLLTFVGPCPEGMEARHLDGNKHNNNLANLAWGTPKQNARDKIAHGTHPEGENNGYSKLKECDVLQIRKMLSHGIQHLKIASLFAIHPTHVSQIKRRLLWRHVA